MAATFAATAVDSVADERRSVPADRDWIALSVQLGVGLQFFDASIRSSAAPEAAPATTFVPTMLPAAHVEAVLGPDTVWVPLVVDGVPQRYSAPTSEAGLQLADSDVTDLGADPDAKGSADTMCEADGWDLAGLSGEDLKRRLDGVREAARAAAWSVTGE
ncbi:MAG: hypothetical protein GX868_10725 [Actinobacteria bacterium]|nr:hypothetical protein [Actinomycetota bacterium]